MSDVSPLSPVLVAMDIPQIVGRFCETPIQGSAPPARQSLPLPSRPRPLWRPPPPPPPPPPRQSLALPSADRRLWLGFLRHRRAHRFAFFDKTNLAMFRKTGAGWN